MNSAPRAQAVSILFRTVEIPDDQIKDLLYHPILKKKIIPVNVRERARYRPQLDGRSGKLLPSCVSSLKKKPIISAPELQIPLHNNFLTQLSASKASGKYKIKDKSKQYCGQNIKR